MPPHCKKIAPELVAEARQHRRLDGTVSCGSVRAWRQAL
jgi:hypothetical protein